MGGLSADIRFSWKHLIKCTGVYWFTISSTRILLHNSYRINLLYKNSTVRARLLPRYYVITKLNSILRAVLRQKNLRDVDTIFRLLSRRMENITVIIYNLHFKIANVITNLFILPKWQSSFVIDQYETIESEINTYYSPVMLRALLHLDFSLGSYTHKIW